MNLAAGPRLAAAVANAGGLACIGGTGVPKCPEYETMTYEGFVEFLSHQTPERARLQIRQMKAEMINKDAPFGVDLMYPSVGGSARKTNFDYTRGQFEAIVDIIIEEKARFFVCALGAPPKRIIDKLHNAGIIVANIIGHPRQVQKSLDMGVDMIIAQGSEGGGHSGRNSFSLAQEKEHDLMEPRSRTYVNSNLGASRPTVVQLCNGRVSELTGQPIIVLCAGGIFDGRGLAAALMYGADGVWVGTRFVAALESGASDGHQQAILNASIDDTDRSIIFTGRPMTVLNTPFVQDWTARRSDESKALTAKGILPVSHMLTEMERNGTAVDKTLDEQIRPILMGQVAGVIDQLKSAKAIVDEMVGDAVKALRRSLHILSRL